jgi:hypothetical protein
MVRSCVSMMGSIVGACGGGRHGGLHHSGGGCRRNSLAGHSFDQYLVLFIPEMRRQYVSLYVSLKAINLSFFNSAMEKIIALHCYSFVKNFLRLYKDFMKKLTPKGSPVPAVYMPLMPPPLSHTEK